MAAFIFIVSMLFWFNRSDVSEKEFAKDNSSIHQNDSIEIENRKIAPESKSIVISDTINVKDYGAVGNGISDDTKSFQRAVAALGIGSSILYIPTGVYKISSKIDIFRNNVNIIGKGSPVLKFTNENCKINNQGYCYCDLGIHIGANLSGVVIDGLRIVGSTTNQIVSYGITVWDFSKDITIRNCSLDGFTGGILFNRKNRNLLCENNIYKNMTFVPAVKAGGYGIVFQSSEKTIVKNCRFESSVYRHAVYYARNQKYLEEYGFDHEFFDNVVYGSMQNHYITGYELALKILGNSKIRIERNSFIGGIGHIWITKNKTGVNRDPKNIYIRNNLFKNIVNSGSMKFYAIGIDDNAKTDDLFIVNNKFENNNVNCLLKLQYGENITIENNIINKITQGHFLFVEYNVDNLLVSNNKVDGMDSGFYGVIIGSPDTKSKLLNKSSLTMKNNIIKGCGIGMLISSPFSGEIEDNDIYAKVGGISLPETHYDGIILRNRIYQSKWGIKSNKSTNKMAYPKNFFNGVEL